MTNIRYKIDGLGQRQSGGAAGKRAESSRESVREGAGLVEGKALT